MQGAKEGAAEFYEKSIQYQPQQTEAYLRLAFLKRDRLKAPDEADTVIDRIFPTCEERSRGISGCGINSLQVCPGSHFAESRCWSR